MLHSVKTWDQRTFSRGDKVKYASINLWNDPRYHGIITDFASANICYVKWNGQSQAIAEFLPNLMLD